VQKISEMLDVVSFLSCIRVVLNSQKSKETYSARTGYQTQDLSHAQRALYNWPLDNHHLKLLFMLRYVTQT